MTDKPPTQSVLRPSTGSKEFTLEDLREIEHIKRYYPGQKEATLKSGKRVQNLQDLIICDDIDRLANLLSTKLAHNKVTPRYVRTLYMVCPEDHPVILREVQTHLSQFSDLPRSEKTKKAEEFIKDTFFLNWDKFSKRNQGELVVAIAGTAV